MIFINTRIYSAIKQRYQNPMINSAFNSQLSVSKKSCVTFDKTYMPSRRIKKKDLESSCNQLAHSADKSNTVKLNKKDSNNCFDFILKTKSKKKRVLNSLEPSLYQDENKKLSLDDINLEKRESICQNKNLDDEKSPSNIQQNNNISKKKKVNSFFKFLLLFK